MGRKTDYAIALGRIEKALRIGGEADRGDEIFRPLTGPTGAGGFRIRRRLPAWRGSRTWDLSHALRATRSFLGRRMSLSFHRMLMWRSGLCRTINGIGRVQRSLSSNEK